MHQERHHRRTLILIGGVIFFLVVCALLFLRVQKKALPKSSDFSLPEKARAVIHFSSSTAPGSLFEPKPQSLLCVYDDAGNILKQITVDEEVVGPFIAKRDDKLLFLMKDSTIVSSVSQSRRLESENAIDFDAVNFGPSQTGCIDDLQLTYSLLNVGALSNQPYINVVRFISDTESYDISVPYYLEDIVYDSANRQMFCIIHNSELNTDAELAYVIIKYDPAVGRFVLNEKEHFIMADTPCNIHYRKSIVHENRMYSLSYQDTAAYMSDPDPDKLRTHCDLVLYEYDLADDAKLSETCVIRDFALSQTDGDLMLSGSNQLPMCAENDRLYAFLRTNEVLIVDLNGEITKRQLPFTFTDVLNLKNPLDDTCADHFFASEIQVDEAGNINILNLYRDKMFRIHRLCSDGTYELLWQGALPKDAPENMLVNDFRLIG